jgi:hypothetical protein
MPTSSGHAQKPIPRLLVVSDAALADADQLPPSVRALIDSAAEVFVVTPSLPRRASWIADDVNHSRDVAEDRLIAVLLLRSPEPDRDADRCRRLRRSGAADLRNVRSRRFQVDRALDCAHHPGETC